MRRILLPAGLLLTLGAACATTGTSAPMECPEVTPQPAAEGAPALFDPALVQVAQTAQGTHKIKLFFDAEGRPIKQAVYHRDFKLMPEAVRKTVEAEAPGGELIAAESELYAGVGRVFEVEVKLPDGRELEVSVKEDGTLYYVERKLDPKLLADSVRATVEATVPGGTIDEVETKKGPDMDVTLLEVIDPQGVQHYLRFAPGGKLVGHTLRFTAQVEVPAP